MRSMHIAAAEAAEAAAGGDGCRRGRWLFLHLMRFTISSISVCNERCEEMESCHLLHALSLLAVLLSRLTIYVRVRSFIVLRVCVCACTSVGD